MAILLALGLFAAAQNVEDFAHSRQWTRTLFYRHRGQHYQSLVVLPQFFAAGEAGKTDPQQELASELKLFRDSKFSPDDARAPQCRFPFRYKLLLEKFSLPVLAPCTALEQWRNKYQASGLSLVYASQYVANPSSVFGHSFMLTTSQKQVEALWYTVNYAASIPDNVSAFSYAWGGLTGWYAGDFSIMPFYQRLFYYGNVEDRDLWIYPVQLSADELDSAFRLMWELVHGGRFVYYFLDENCAGELLRTFAAILPETELNERLPLYVHPIDILKFLERAGKLGPVRLIPSQYSVLRTKYDRLTLSEKKQFRNAVAKPEADLPLDGPNTSEAVMEYTAYEMRQNQGEVPVRLRPLEKRAFIVRAQYGLLPAAQVPAEVLNQAPHLAHDGMASEFGGSFVNGHLTADLMYRVALHGSLDPEAGFLANSAFEFFKIAVSAESHQVWVKDFTLLNMENFPTFWMEEPKFAWRVNLHAAESLLTDDPANLLFEGKFSGGTAFSVGRQLVYFLVTGAVNGGHDLPQGHYDFAPELGWRWHLDKWRGFADLAYGSSAFEPTPRAFLNWGYGVSWAIDRRFEILHETVVNTVPALQMSGYRAGIGVRTFF